jgi:hypothetical protein
MALVEKDIHSGSAEKRTPYVFLVNGKYEKEVGVSRLCPSKSDEEGAEGT